MHLLFPLQTSNVSPVEIFHFKKKKVFSTFCNHVSKKGGKAEKTGMQQTQIRMKHGGRGGDSGNFSTLS